MHLDFYKSNPGYAKNLRASDPRQFQALPQLCPTRSFWEKYERALRVSAPRDSLILDLGCGVGQVVRSLSEAGFNAHGVDVAQENLTLARQHSGTFHLFDGTNLPYAAKSVAAIGAFNVLEHVEHPIPLLDEMTRVLQPGGRIVLSSPNFLRVFGWRDYHPHMRRKWRNAQTLVRHLRAYRSRPAEIIFEQMPPIHRKIFQPDDDAITVTNALDFRQYLKSRGYEKIEVSCVDRPVPKWLETLLDLTPLRYVILNSFVTARRPE